MKRSWVTISAVLLLLSACTHRPPVPDWQVEAAGAAERFTAAYLRGDERVQAAEFARARAQMARTGEPAQVARIELLRCALQAASLVPADGCPGLAPLQADAGDALRAYADYLEGRPLPLAAVPLLPPAQQAVALDITAGKTTPGVAGIEDPVSRLVAAGVLLRAGRLGTDVAAAAVDTAAAQGWQRPLLAWLGVQRDAAEQTGLSDEAQRLRRRIDLVAPPASR